MVIFITKLQWIENHFLPADAASPGNRTPEANAELRPAAERPNTARWYYAVPSAFSPVSRRLWWRGARRCTPPNPWVRLACRLLPRARSLSIADVQPLFTAHCVDCHGPDKQKGGWRADDPKYALHAGDSFGPNILPGTAPPVL